MFHSLGLFGIYLMLYGNIWGWAVVTDDDTKGLSSVWHIYEVSRNLQAKISASDVVGRLGSCLQEVTPGRNATIADVSVCVRVCLFKSGEEKGIDHVQLSWKGFRI